MNHNKSVIIGLVGRHQKNNLSFSFLLSKNFLKSNSSSEDGKVIFNSFIGFPLINFLFRPLVFGND